MKILIVHDFFQQPGGENVVAQQDIERLKATDEVFVYQRHNDEINAFGAARTLKFVADTIHSRTTADDIPKIAKEFRPDFAYVHNIYPLISPSLYHALHACGVPILQVVHDFRPFCANGWFYTNGHICDACKAGNHLHAIRNRCYRESYALSALYATATAYCRRSGAFDKIDAYLCLTEFTRSILMSEGIPSEKIHVRPNSIDVSRVRPDNGEGEYVAYIGRLSSEKGLWTLMRAFENLSVPLKIAGTGPLESQLLSYISERKLHNIEMLGFVSGDAKWDFLRNARFTVVPSECYEMFPIALLEAYGAGKPVIASDLGGFSSLVDEGESGMLFKPGDPDDLARLVEQLWNRPQLVNKMGKAARTKVETRYSPEETYKQLIAIAKRVCRGYGRDQGNRTPVRFSIAGNRPSKEELRT